MTQFFIMMLRKGILVVSLLFGSVAAKRIGSEASLYSEDESFWGRLLGAGSGGDSFSFSITTDDDIIKSCVDSFEAIEYLIQKSKVSSDRLSIRICKDARVDFVREIDLKGSKFDMFCENGNTCRLDANTKTNFFTAGAFDGPLSTHDVSFDTIHFFNGKTEGSGGVFQLFGGKSRFKGCAFLNNVASDGGAMRIQDGIVEIDGCLFQYNSAEDVGGAMKVEESLNGVLDMTIRNTTFTGNTAGTEGDDIFQDNSGRGPIDCGAASGNQFCDAEPSTSPEISTNAPETTCAGASIEQCPIVDHQWNIVNLY